MLLTFFYGNSCTSSPIVIRNMVVEHVHMFKLLGVTDNRKWDSHCDIVVRKANKWLYALRQPKKCGVYNQDIVVVYCSVVRSVLKYGCVIFNNLSKYLSESLERVQKRAMNIIFPSSCYEAGLLRQVLQHSSLATWIFVNGTCLT